MASKTYVSYASEAFYETQKVYMEGNSKKEIMENLRAIGTRRILFVCSSAISTYKNFEDLIRKYESFGFRCFVFKRSPGLLYDIQIQEGLKIYKEYNCDTIITVGGTDEIDCGKMISAMTTNDSKTPQSLVGINSIKKDISVLCCIVTDNSFAASVGYAEFMDSTRNKWVSAFSSFLIPQMVVIDTEICLRSEKQADCDGILTSLSLAIESYLSPVSDLYPAFKSNAVVSSLLLVNNMEKHFNNPDDDFVRKCTAIGSYYAGLSSTFVGIGYVHIMIHSLIERHGDVHGVDYLKLLSILLRESEDIGYKKVAELSRELHFCSKSLDDKSAAEMFYERLDIIADRYSEYSTLQVIPDDEIKSIIEDVRRESISFELKKIPNNVISSVLKTYNSGVRIND